MTTLFLLFNTTIVLGVTGKFVIKGPNRILKHKFKLPLISLLQKRYTVYDGTFWDVVGLVFLIEGKSDLPVFYYYSRLKIVSNNENGLYT